MEAKAKQEADVLAAQAAAERELQSLPPLQQSKLRLSRALDELRLSCGVDSDYVLAVGMLLRFSSQIIANPHEARHRSLNVNNPIIRQRLIAKKGGADALQAIGFTSRAAAPAGAAPATREEGRDTEEWSVQPTAEAWTVVTQAKAMLEAELKDAQSGKKRVACHAAVGSVGSSPRLLCLLALPACSVSCISTRSLLDLNHAGAVCNPLLLRRLPLPSAAANPFALFSQMFNPAGGAGAGSGAAQPASLRSSPLHVRAACGWRCSRFSCCPCLRQAEPKHLERSSVPGGE